MIDSHCHLDYDYAPKTADDLVREAEAAGVTHLLTIGTEFSRMKPIQEISERFPNVFHSVGIHPHEAVSLKNEGECTLEELRKFARHPKCRAIGEIGLDYYYDHSPREIQIQKLEEQLDLAIEMKLPVVIHSRDAEEDLLPKLQNYAKRTSLESGRPVGALHCFTGTYDFGRACVDLGFLISFSGILTFKNAESLRDSAKRFPLDRLMVETDSPFLAPIPFRGKKCEPAMVKHTALCLAGIKGVGLDELDRVTTETTRRFFRI